MFVGGEPDDEVRGLFLRGESDVEADAAPSAGADVDVDVDVDAGPVAFLSKCAETATSTTAVTLSSVADHLLALAEEDDVAAND